MENKLKLCLENALELKSSPRRASFLQEMSRCFADRYVPEFLLDKPVTMADLLEKSLKKGKSEEQAAAASLAATLVLQYGASSEGAIIQRSLSKIFMTTLQESTVPAAVREKIASALAITTYIAEEEPHNTCEVMEHLKAVFSKSCPNGDMKMPVLPPAESSLHQTALLSWGLLLTVTEDRVHNLIDRNLATVTCLLHTPDVDVRVAAGEVLATMYELARDRDSDFEGDDLERLCEELHTLATDSAKSRAKRDRRTQRASFREIEKAVRDGEKPDFKVHFAGEILRVGTWEDKRTYDAVCSILGSGMNHHLQFNPEVRTLFGLGAPYPTNLQMPVRVIKVDRAVHVMNDRARTKRLAKCRDKRLDIM